MTLPSLTAYARDGVAGYEIHIPPIRELLASLPNVQHYTTYPGGFMLKLNAGHYVAVLMPPCGAAEKNLLTHLDDYYDGDWQTFSVEAFGTGKAQVIAWHMTPPWA